MTDYAAAALQPIVQGLLTTDGTIAAFLGKGVSAAVRTGAGNYLLTLDQGLPGNAGAENAGLARSSITLRGGSGAPPVTTITQVAITYVKSAAALANPLIGFDQVRLVFSIAGAGTDIDGAVASGAEVIIWKGL